MQKPHVRNDTKPDKRFKVLRNRDIKLLRTKLLEEQKGLDPITNEEITNQNLDHCHTEGIVRSTLEGSTNMFLGKIENFYKRFIRFKGLPITLPDILRNIATYLEKEYEPILHPKSVGDLVSRFSRLKAEEQDKIMQEAGLDISGTKANKTKRYRKYLMRDENILKF